MFIELEASDRDQVGYACSAQNNKLLPKRRKTGNNRKQAAEQLKASASKFFGE